MAGGSATKRMPINNDNPLFDPMPGCVSGIKAWGGWGGWRWGEGGRGGGGSRMSTQS